MSGLRSGQTAYQAAVPAVPIIVWADP